MFSAIQSHFQKIDNSKLFQAFVIVVIVVSAISVGAHTHILPTWMEGLLLLLDKGITIFFAIEIIIIFEFGVEKYYENKLWLYLFHKIKNLKSARKLRFAVSKFSNILFSNIRFFGARQRGKKVLRTPSFPSGRAPQVSKSRMMEFEWCIQTLFIHESSIAVIDDEWPMARGL